MSESPRPPEEASSAPSVPEPAVAAQPAPTTAPVQPASSVLTPELLAKLRERIAALGEGDCDFSVIGRAQRISDPDHKGSTMNVYAALPQIADDVRLGKHAKININGNDTVDRPELTAAMIAAAQIAKRTGIKLEEVKVEDIAQLTPEICEKLQGKGSLSCKPSR